jgi:hypothetical protein
MTLKMKLVSIILILFFSGCTEKDELTLPVRIHFKIWFKQREPDFVAYPYAEYFSFSEGQIGIQSISFEGKREAGEDVFFETDPKISIPTVEFGEQPGSISDFEIPQGIYNYIRWGISLKKIMSDELIDDNDLDSLHTGLVIKGYFNKIWWNLDGYGVADSTSAIPFVLTIDDIEQFSCISVNSNSGFGRGLSENKDYSAYMLLDLVYAFESISGESIDISGDILHQKIMISSRENKDLYTIILHRIATSTKVNI